MKAKPSGYWNYDKKSKQWSPKDEPRCGDSLHLLLDSLFALKNIEVTREDGSRSGNCDFGFSASLASYERVSALFELKKAHSNDLEHGLSEQLPKYLEERGSTAGIYGVLWFKGKHFEKPKKDKDETLDACIERLHKIRPENVFDVVGFDVAFKKSASTRSGSD